MSAGRYFLILVLTAAAAGPALAGEARLPYRQLYEVQKAEAEWNAAHTNLIVVMIMQSTSTNVRTSDLEATIESKAGKIPIVIGPAGDFLLPMREYLYTENPWVTLNQPRGTMKLNWQIGVVPGPITNTVHYARLMQPVRDSEDVQDQMRRFFPGSPRLIMTGLKMTFPSGPKKAVAIIHARDGDRKLQANEHDEIILPLAPDLISEDPLISLSSIPAALGIVSHPAER